MNAGRRIYRTAEGRHVVEGHPDAAFLAYGVADEVPEEVLAELPAAAGDDTEAAGDAQDDAKQRPAPANKARRATANKAGG
ncbi:hypothetical protein GCM10010124_26100 [Pilimelia terevasa]|uniref:Uncharacterized protein n=1 Tax=Pilimelia terevasa TaxID=53372 RepID=A0A8J3FL49_9ACTN|nr:hypothetical protein [Pilimelia terevasa]GGK32120.1 hypothetical protein GCM10010124_26100 [Pilimelia terevasa]